MPTLDLPIDSITLIPPGTVNLRHRHAYRTLWMPVADFVRDADGRVEGSGDGRA